MKDSPSRDELLPVCLWGFIFIFLLLTTSCRKHSGGPPAKPNHLTKTNKNHAAVQGDHGKPISREPKTTFHKPFPPTGKKIPEALPQDQPARFAIIIDDFGTSNEAAQPFLDAPFPIAISVLPQLRYSESVSRQARKAGKPILLHLPVEAAKENQFLGPGALLTSMNDQSLKETFDTDLKSVPDAQGVNNHLGSKGTQDPRVAHVIAEEAKIHHLFLIDSLTAPDSILYDQAKKQGVPAAKREVFLDNVIDEGSILAQLQELIKIAQKKGKAIGIGHPHPETLKVLMKVIPTLQSEKKKIEIVPVTELLD